MKCLMFVLVLGFSTSQLMAQEAKWNCMKDGKAVEVKGENDLKKKAACEALKGTWSEEEKAKQQSAGKGASW